GGNNPKGFLQAYNVQAVVDTDSGIVVAVEATNQAADSPHLPAMVGAIERNVSRLPKELLADAGYYSETNLEVLEQKGISALIPPEKVTHRQWRHPGPSPRGRIPKGMSRRDRMRRRLETKAGRAVYKLRQETIEPVFGQVKEQQGFRRFLLRGLRGARAETFLVFLTYNLRKLFFTFRGRRKKLCPAGAVA
ncbi:MAG: transposase, partial [Firmicutes bacterium]|nr:transposase [Bacillota bacterium]